VARPTRAEQRTGLTGTGRSLVSGRGAARARSRGLSRRTTVRAPSVGSAGHARPAGWTCPPRAVRLHAHRAIRLSRRGAPARPGVRWTRSGTRASRGGYSLAAIWTNAGARSGPRDAPLVAALLLASARGMVPA